MYTEALHEKTDSVSGNFPPHSTHSSPDFSGNLFLVFAAKNRNKTEFIKPEEGLIRHLRCDQKYADTPGSPRVKQAVHFKFAPENIKRFRNMNFWTF